MKSVLTHLVISQLYPTQQPSRIQSRMIEFYRHLLKPKRLPHPMFHFLEFLCHPVWHTSKYRYYALCGLLIFREEGMNSRLHSIVKECLCWIQTNWS